MSLSKSVFALYKAAKQGNAKLFIKLIEENRVLNNLPALSSLDTAQLISSFKLLKITDKNIWRTLENLFISKKNFMQVQDMLTCTSAFCRVSDSPKVWQAI